MCEAATPLPRQHSLLVHPTEQDITLLHSVFCIIQVLHTVVR